MNKEETKKKKKKQKTKPTNKKILSGYYFDGRKLKVLYEERSRIWERS